MQFFATLVILVGGMVLATLWLGHLLRKRAMWRKPTREEIDRIEAQLEREYRGRIPKHEREALEEMRR
jgi:hypothetical protein